MGSVDAYNLAVGMTAQWNVIAKMSPLLTFLFDLALKMALTATIVVIISVVVERSGPFVGALVAALAFSLCAASVS